MAVLIVFKIVDNITQKRELLAAILDFLSYIKK